MQTARCKLHIAHSVQCRMCTLGTARWRREKQRGTGCPSLPHSPSPATKNKYPSSTRGGGGDSPWTQQPPALSPSLVNQTPLSLAWQQVMMIHRSSSRPQGRQKTSTRQYLAPHNATPLAPQSAAGVLRPHLEDGCFCVRDSPVVLHNSRRTMRRTRGLLRTGGQATAMPSTPHPQTRFRIPTHRLTPPRTPSPSIAPRRRGWAGGGWGSASPAPGPESPRLTRRTASRTMIGLYPHTDSGTTTYSPEARLHETQPKHVPPAGSSGNPSPPSWFTPPTPPPPHTRDCAEHNVAGIHRCTVQF